MGLFKKRKKTKADGTFEKIEVDGKPITISSFYMFTEKKDKKKYIELAAFDTTPELHFTEVDISVWLSDKRLELHCAFNKAYESVKHKIYRFEILGMKQFYI